MNVTSFNGTLTTTSFYILLAVAEHPLHGYGIRGQIAIDSGSELIIPTGSLYPAIHRLVANMHLDQIETPDHQGNLVRRYRITQTGQRRLSREAKRLRHIAYHAQLKLGQGAFD